MARPVFASERVVLPESPALAYGFDGSAPRYGAPAGYRPAVYNAPVEYRAERPRAVRTSRAAAAPALNSGTRIDRAPRRNWKKTALVIGGSTAAAAGIGGLI